MHKTLFITSNTSNIHDEGKQKTFKNIYKNYQTKFNSIACSLRGKKINDDHTIITANKFFISCKLIKYIRSSDLSHILYVPSESLTIGTLIRILFLQFAKTNDTILCLLIIQHNARNDISKKIISIILKNLKLKIISSSSTLLNDYKEIDAKPILLGVNIEKYCRVSKEKKYNLRKKWNLDIDSKVVLHIGHLTNSRNLDDLIYLREKISNIKILIVASSFNANNDKKNIKEKLIKNNIIVFDDYINDINEIYQLSDYYIFMVENENGAIGCPLSILEAYSCELNIITKPFGLIPTFFSEEDLLYYKNKGELLNYFKSDFNNSLLKNKKIDLSWDRVVNEINNFIINS